MTLSVTSLVVGQTATITVTSESRKGDTITVNLTGANQQTDSVQITIGENGTGSADWEVQDWGSVTIADGVCDAINRQIESPPEEPG